VDSRFGRDPAISPAAIARLIASIELDLGWHLYYIT
jgi:hypothetical protein